MQYLVHIRLLFLSLLSGIFYLSSDISFPGPWKLDVMFCFVYLVTVTCYHQFIPKQSQPIPKFVYFIKLQYCFDEPKILRFGNQTMVDYLLAHKSSRLPSMFAVFQYLICLNYFDILIMHKLSLVESSFIDFLYYNISPPLWQKYRFIKGTKLRYRKETNLLNDSPTSR